MVKPVTPGRNPVLRAMMELRRTNDPVEISWLTAVLASGGIEAVVLDSHTSVLEGQVGAIPRRVMVLDEEYRPALALIAEAETRRADDAAAVESLDALLGGRVHLHQPTDGYRVAIDPVFLAAAVPPVSDVAGRRVLDVGTGVGAAALCYATRVPDAAVTGLEIQDPLVELARRNAEANGLADRVTFVHGDLLRPTGSALDGTFAHVMANPPFLPRGRADPRTGDAKAASHIEGEATLAAWLDFCLRKTAPKGTLTLIHRADRLDEILALLHGRAGGIVVFPLWPKREQAPKRVIVRARPGLAQPFRLDPGMVLHEDDGRYTRMAEAVLAAGAAITL